MLGPNKESAMSQKVEKYKEAIARVRKGEDKNQLFEEYKEILGEKHLATQLGTYPDLHLKNKYNGLNNVLIAAVAILAIMKVISLVDMSLSLGAGLAGLVGAALIGPLINVIAIYALYIRHVFIYRLVALFALSSIFELFKPSNFRGLEGVFDWSWFSIGLVALLICIWLGFYLPKKMFPYFGWFKPKEVKNGLPVFSASAS